MKNISDNTPEADDTEVSKVETPFDKLSRLVRAAPNKASGIWLIRDALAAAELNSGPTAISKVYTKITSEPMRPQQVRNTIQNGRPKGQTRAKIDVNDLISKLS